MRCWVKEIIFIKLLKISTYRGLSFSVSQVFRASGFSIIISAKGGICQNHLTRESAPHTGGVHLGGLFKNRPAW